MKKWWKKKSDKLEQACKLELEKETEQCGLCLLIPQCHRLTLDREAEWQWAEIQQCILRALLEQMFKYHATTPPLIPAILPQVKNREIAL